MVKPVRLLSRITVGVAETVLRGGVDLRRRLGALVDAGDDATLAELRTAPPSIHEEFELSVSDGVRIHGLTAGDGPTVVLVHGYALSAASWNLVTRPLVDDGHRIVTFDWRAHGSSTAGNALVTTELLVDDLVAVLDHVGVDDDAVLVGHSTGGYVAMAALVERPELQQRFRGLVLAATLAGQLLDIDPATSSEPLRGNLLMRLVRNRALRVLLSGFLAGRGVSSDVSHELLSEFADTDHDALVSLLGELADNNYYARLDSIALPTVVLSGDRDRTTPRPHAEAIVDGIPGARLESVGGAGHLLNWEHPDRIVAAITELLVPSP